jgi:hypothetical protein
MSDHTKTQTSSTFEDLKKFQQGHRKVGLGFKGVKLKNPKKLEKKHLVDGKKPEI